jgi:hypothetical protein
MTYVLPKVTYFRSGNLRVLFSSFIVDFKGTFHGSQLRKSPPPLRIPTPLTLRRLGRRAFASRQVFPLDGGSGLGLASTAI